MKKALGILCVGFITMLIMSMCDKYIEKFYKTGIENLRANLYDGENEISGNETLSSDDLNLKIYFNLHNADKSFSSAAKNFFPTAYAYLPPILLSEGMSDKISGISMTCDKPIGGFAAGHNLLSEVKGYFITSHYQPLGYLWSIEEWINALNAGKYHEKKLALEETYKFEITTLLPDVEVEEDDYIFTFRLDYVSGKNSYVVTFSPVRLR